MLLTYLLNYFEIVLVVSVITGNTFVFIFHMRSIYTVRSLYFIISSVSFLITFLGSKILTFITISIFIITDYDVRFIVRGGSDGLHLLSPHYCYYYLGSIGLLVPNRSFRDFRLFNVDFKR